MSELIGEYIKDVWQNSTEKERKEWIEAIWAEIKRQVADEKSLSTQIEQVIEHEATQRNRTSNSVS